MFMDFFIIMHANLILLKIHLRHPHSIPPFFCVYANKQKRNSQKISTVTDFVNILCLYLSSSFFLPHHIIILIVMWKHFSLLYLTSPCGTMRNFLWYFSCMTLMLNVVKSPCFVFIHILRLYINRLITVKKYLKNNGRKIFEKQQSKTIWKITVKNYLKKISKIQNWKKSATLITSQKVRFKSSISI